MVISAFLEHNIWLYNKWMIFHVFFRFIVLIISQNAYIRTKNINTFNFLLFWHHFLALKAKKWPKISISLVTICLEGVDMPYLKSFLYYIDFQKVFYTRFSICFLFWHFWSYLWYAFGARLPPELESPITRLERTTPKVFNFAIFSSCTLHFSKNGYVPNEKSYRFLKLVHTADPKYWLYYFNFQSCYIYLIPNITYFISISKTGTYVWSKIFLILYWIQKMGPMWPFRKYILL